MRVELLFPSRFLSAADLIQTGGERTVTIARVYQDSLQMRDGSRQKKALIEFRGAQKALVLNKTNCAIIAGLYGPETDAWAGQRITLYPTRVDAFGKLTDAIRVRPTVPALPSASAPVQTRGAAPTAPAGPAQPLPEPDPEDLAAVGAGNGLPSAFSDEADSGDGSSI